MRTTVELDAWVVMPNHFHGIVVLGDEVNPSCRGDLRSPLLRLKNMKKMADDCRFSNKGDQEVAPTGPRSKSIGSIMAGFKSAVTKRVNIVRQTSGLPLWQRNYWDHVVRDEADLNRIREYIHTNPSRWDLDSLHREPK